jgi:hypothetical protein
MIDPVVSVLPATNRQYFILALTLSLPFRWLRVTPRRVVERAWVRGCVLLLF